MTLENQVCSLEQAKRLKELGVQQNSLFAYWTANHNKLSRLNIAEYETVTYYSIHAEGGTDFNAIMGTTDDFVCAFTVAELGQLMGIAIKAGYSATEELEAKYKDRILSDDFPLMFEPQFLADNIIDALERKIITL